jgi:hypothetical protein
MAFVRPAGAAAVLVTLSLLFQTAGMGVLIHWARAYFARGVHRHNHLRSALLLVVSRAELAARNTGFLVNPEKNLTPFRRI